MTDRADERTVQADVIIIGSGASGLTSALTLSFAGASVAIFEQESEPGGMTNYAEGMFAVGSKLQKKHKVGLTVQEAFNTHMEETHWLANARLIRAFMEKTADTVEWLEGLGAQFSGLFNISPQTPRVWHQFEGLCREGLVKPLFEKVQAQKNIEVLFETQVKSLVMEEGKAAGLLAEDKDGNIVRAKGKAVIIASGGYQDNKEWVNRYCKSGFTTPVIPANQVGGPIQMAWDVGAEPYDLGVMQNIVLVPGEDLGAQLLVAGCQPRLWINTLGERYCNESICWRFPLAGNALARQPGATAYSIFDQDSVAELKDKGPRWVLGEFYDILKPLSDLDEELARGMKDNKVFQADTIEGLAAQIGVDAPTFKATVDEYNECYEENCDFVFDKPTVYLQPIRKPSFYAIRLGLSAFMTNGGIRISHKTEVLTKERKPIPGLYAAGCCVGGLLGDTYEVSTTGGSLSFALNSGRMAGENVLKYLGR